MHFIARKYIFNLDFTEIYTYLINNSPSFVQVMAWRPEGDKPLPEPMMTQTCDALWHN